MPSSFAFSKFRLSVLFVSLCQTVVERLRSERNLACPAGAQEGRHQGFHPLVNHPFPKLVWRRPETGDRFENGERQRIFSSVGAHSVRPFLYFYAVPNTVLLQHIGYSPQARHTRVAQLVGLAVTDGTCEYSSVRTLYLVISSLSTLHSSLYCTRKKRKAFAFLSPIYNLLYPLGVTIASSGVPAAQSGQALPRTKFW